jgi:hypothetical protein
MKLGSILIIVWMLFVKTSVFGQTKALSKHEFSFYINAKEREAVKVEISVVVSGDTISSEIVEASFYFPVIDSSKRFDLIIRVDGIVFSGQNYPGWVLNKGSRFIFGKLTKLKNLISVADYNGMTKADKGWELYSKRVFVVDHTYTIDIDNRFRIKELQFLIISPNSSDKLMTTQKVVK